MKKGDIKRKTRNYLNNKMPKYEEMNPTIRSKIIFGVAAIYKKFHARNINTNNLKLDKIYLDENLEPKISGFRYNFTTDIEILCSLPHNLAPEVLGSEKYTAEADVYSFGMFLYQMFTNELILQDGRPIRNNQQYYMKIIRGAMLKRPDMIPDCYWDLLLNCWKKDYKDRPTFAQITEILKDDKYALEEFGMKTDLEQLHEYQKRIDTE